MFSLNKKNIYLLLFAIFLLFGFSQSAQAVTKAIGETADITVTCSDVDGNLTQCNITSPAPASKNCSVSGYSGSCSGEFTCTEAGTYDICGQAIDAQGLVDNNCLDVVVCNSPPQKPSTVSAEDWNYCGIQAAAIPTFTWTYSDPDGDPQMAYEIRIDDDPNFDPVIYEPDEFVRQATSTSVSFSPIPAEWSAYMNWSDNYWWIVRVRDSQGAWSEWSNNNPFNTPMHAYPWADFEPVPANPSVDEVVEFVQNDSGIARALCYNGGEHLCQDDPSTVYEWDYTYESGPGFQTDSTKKGNATTTYPAAGPYEAWLRITDNTLLGSNKSCTQAETVNVSLPLPEYREAPPTVFFKKAIAGFLGFFQKIF